MPPLHQNSVQKGTRLTIEARSFRTQNAEVSVLQKGTKVILESLCRLHASLRIDLRLGFWSIKGPDLFDMLVRCIPSTALFKHRPLSCSLDDDEVLRQESF